MITLRHRTLAALFAGVTLTVVASLAFQAWRTDAAPGDIDATFVPIDACRLVDTRPTNRVGVHGPFGANETKTITARSTSGNCFIPPDATGLSLNVTAIGATAPTFLTIWASGALPNASSLNPSPGQPPTPNAVVTPLSSSGTFQIYNLSGTLNVIVDVNGYFSPASLQQIQDRLASLEGSNVPPSPSGFSARITGYGPAGSITRVVGDVTNGLPVEEDVRVDVRCPNGTVEIDRVFDVPPGQTRGWSVLCDGVFTSGATITTVLI